MTMDPITVVNDIVGRLQDAWNNADGNGFGAAFAPDADFVDIRGDVHKSREAIAAGHEAVLNSIYSGSTVRYEVITTRTIGDEVLVCVVRAALEAPSGPLAGRNNSVWTAVIERRLEDWQIVSFQNTLVAG